MKKEHTFTADNLENALHQAEKSLHLPADKLTHQVADESDGAVTIKVTRAPFPPKLELALEFIASVLHVLNVHDFTFNITEEWNSTFISIDGEGLDVIIGEKGEVLDALQFLTTNVINRDKKYFRITLDSASFRTKRMEELCSLAQKAAISVRITGQPITLDPMNPADRRVVYDEMSMVLGVSAKSMGVDPYRRIVLFDSNRPQDYQIAEEMLSNRNPLINANAKLPFFLRPSKRKRYMAQGLEADALQAAGQNAQQASDTGGDMSQSQPRRKPKQMSRAARLLEEARRRYGDDEEKSDEALSMEQEFLKAME